MAVAAAPPSHPPACAPMQAAFSGRQQAPPPPLPAAHSAPEAAPETAPEAVPPQGEGQAAAGGMPCCSRLVIFRVLAICLGVVALPCTLSTVILSPRTAAEGGAGGEPPGLAPNGSVQRKGEEQEAASKHGSRSSMSVTLLT
jgi:hypothetical protein